MFATVFRKLGAAALENLLTEEEQKKYVTAAESFFAIKRGLVTGATPRPSSDRA
jgi:hypothetical protein